MKRKHSKGNGARTGDVLFNFSQSQLALIGAVAMAYNEAESGVHDLAGIAFEFPGDSFEVVSRINGTEGLVQIIILAAAAFRPPSDTLALLESALRGEGFSQLKTYRDAVVHSRIFDVGSAVGFAPGRQGNRNDVLLSEQALSRLYAKLFYLGKEIDALFGAMSCVATIYRNSELEGLRKSTLERSTSEKTALARHYQSLRLSVPPSPKFPDEPDIHQFLIPDQKELLKKVIQGSLPKDFPFPGEDWD